MPLVLQRNRDTHGDKVADRRAWWRNFSVHGCSRMGCVSQSSQIVGRTLGWMQGSHCQHRDILRCRISYILWNHSAFNFHNHTMNRTSFLSTLPFLYELPSSEWPPAISDDAGTTRRQFLFRDHCLSLEPVSSERTEEETLGPSFFMAPPERQEPFDAGMCRVEMVLFTTPKKKTPYKFVSRTPNKSPSAASKKAMEVEYKE